MIIAVRVRPLNKIEKEDSNYKTINIINKDTLTISIPTDYSIYEKGKGKKKENKINVTKEKQASFKYDFVFDENIKQPQIYKYTSSNLIKQVMEGYNATIFAYGATGTGKTYTMLGNGADFGIMIRSIKDLFILINNNIDKKYIIKISYIEIYNEIIKDLLSNNTNNNNSLIDLRNDPQKGVIIQGIEFKKVLNENEAFNLILKGNKRRSERPTQFNENSSRSHAILQILLEIKDEETKLQREIKFGKFMLLDLAGSEKISSNLNLKGNSELGSINKSLLALNKCITFLISQKNTFIPWRESKLTRLLQDSLSGNSRVVMIATVSQALLAFDETMFTLQYANKAKNLKVNIKQNIIEKVDIRINKYDEFIKNIKEEIIDIKKNINEQDKIMPKNLSDINLNNISTTSNINNNNDIALNTNDFNIKNNQNNQNKITNENENQYDIICKNMLEHFEIEIRLKRKIIEKEKIIDDLKNELAQKEYEILHAPKINLHYLKKLLKEKREDIKEKEKKLIKGYIKQNELNSRRKEFQKIISNLVSNEANNPEFYKLYNMYKYNINLLDSMTIEHKKYINLQELKRKDKKIKGLLEQLDLRDQFIRGAYYQFENNNIKFNFQNPKLISSNQLENIPYRPKIIKIAPSLSTINKGRFIFNTPQKNHNNTIDESNIKTIIKKININNYEKKINEKVENLEKVKNKLMGKVNSSKKRQYNSELLSLFDNNNYKMNGLNINDFIRNKKINISYNNINNESFLSNHNLSVKSLNPINQSFRKVSYILKPNKIKLSKIKKNDSLSERTYSRKYINNSINKPNNISKTNNQLNNSITSQLENEFQKKVKTIINKNYIGRYKRSPYLRFLEE